jgi:hypothetical protein
MQQGGICATQLYFWPLKKGYRMPGKIKQVQEEHTREWMAIPGVEGTAIGLYKGKPCIKVFSSIKPQKLQAKIPSTIEGYPVIIEETGTFQALDRQ